MKIVVVGVPDGRFRFKLLDDGGEVLTASAPYAKKASAMAGVASFKAQLAAAAVEDRTQRGPEHDLNHPVPGSAPPI